MTESSDSPDVSTFWQSSPLVRLLVLSLLLNAANIHAAPLSEDELTSARQTQLSEYYGGSLNSTSCYYNFQHYSEGDRIITNEPCLNCTCHKRMLMCYLRVCPFTKAVGQDCTVEKRPDQCCPVITCPEVPVQLLTSSTTSTQVPPTEPTQQSAAIAYPSTFGCMLENTFYPDGAQVPSDPKNPCELCYCIRNRTACVLQQCTLNVGGCQAIHQPGVCCPVRYDCNYDDLLTSPEPAVGGGSGLLLTTTQSPQQCDYRGVLYSDGELIPLEQLESKSCEKCYCMRGEIVCAVQECGDPLEGKDCEPIPPPEGQCCPTTYLCANETVPIDSLLEMQKHDPIQEDTLVTDSSIILSQDELSHQPQLQVTTEDRPNQNLHTELDSTDEPETADSKPSGSQIALGEDMTKVTSIAETHTEISISTKQGGGSTELPIPIGAESETQRPTHAQEDASDSSSLESAQDKVTTNYYQDSETERVTEPADIELSTEFHVVKPHPIEIDDLENSDGEMSKPNEHVDHPVPAESDDVEHDGIEPDDDDLDKLNENPPSAVATDKPTLNMPTISPANMDDGSSKESEVDEQKASSTPDEEDAASPSPSISEAQDSETGSSIKLESSTIIPELWLTTSAETITDVPKNDIGISDAAPASSDTEAPSAFEQEQESVKISDESTTMKLVISDEKEITENDKESSNVDDNSEHTPSVLSPLVPELIASIEHDEPENSDNEELASGADKTTTNEDQPEKNVDTNQNEAEIQSNPTTSSIGEIELEPGRTTTATELDEQSEKEQTTAGGSNHEVLKTDSTTSRPFDEQHETTESIIDNEISNDVDHQTSPPIRQEEKLPITTDQPTIEIEKGVVPGEGSCLVNGQTYPDGESIPATDPCHIECKCVSSIVHCDTIACPPPPPHMKNCVPIHHAENTCCPTYSCDDEKEKISLETHNQLANPDEVITDKPAATYQQEQDKNDVHNIHITTALPAMDTEEETSTEAQPTIDQSETSDETDTIKEQKDPDIKPGVIASVIPEFIEHDDAQTPEESTLVDTVPQAEQEESDDKQMSTVKPHEIEESINIDKDSTATEHYTTNGHFSLSGDNNETTEKDETNVSVHPQIDIITEPTLDQETERTSIEISTEHIQGIEQEQLTHSESTENEKNENPIEGSAEDESNQHESTTFDVPLSSISPSKFEEYDIQKTTLGPELPKQEDDTIDMATEEPNSPINVPITISPEPIEEHSTQSDLKTEIEEEQTTAPTSDNSQNLLSNVEEVHTQQPLQGSSQDEEVNNVFKPILSAGMEGGAEHDQVSQTIQTEEESVPSEETQTEHSYVEQAVQQTSTEAEETSTELPVHHHTLQHTDAAEPITQSNEPVHETEDDEPISTTLSPPSEHPIENIDVHTTESPLQHHDETTLPESKPEEAIQVTQKSELEQPTTINSVIEHETVSEAADGEEEIPHVEQDVGTPESQTYDNQIDQHKVEEKPEAQEIPESTSHQTIESSSDTTINENQEDIDEDKKHVSELDVKPDNETPTEIEDHHTQYSEDVEKPEEPDTFVSYTTPHILQESTTKYSPPTWTDAQQLMAGGFPEHMLPQIPNWTPKPIRPDPTTEAPHAPEEEEQQPYRPGGGDLDYEEEEENAFGPGTCRYGGKVFVSAQQVPRDNPCDFCFCFRSDIICLQQSCPPPIHGCRQESIQGFCCPRYECPVSMAMTLNLTTSTTTTTTTLPPHFFSHAYRGSARRTGCQIQGHAYRVGEDIPSASGPCLHCICGANGQMKCDPTVCSPEPMLRKMIEAAVSRR